MLNAWNETKVQTTTTNNNSHPHESLMNTSAGYATGANEADMLLTAVAAGQFNANHLHDQQQQQQHHNHMLAQQQQQQHQQQQQQPQSAAAVAAAVATAMIMTQQQQGGGCLMGGGSNSKDGMDDDSMDNDDDDCNSSVNNDAEGVWSPDIEQSFQEALAIYPPCGRRKIILSEEGKMYGRNELIARYIKVRTGKTRSRKQVSSHIQVLAKRKTKDFHNQIKSFLKNTGLWLVALQHTETKDGKFSNGTFPNPFSNLTSAQIISPAPLQLQPASGGQPQQQQQQPSQATPTTNATSPSKLGGNTPVRNESAILNQRNLNAQQPGVGQQMGQQAHIHHQQQQQQQQQQHQPQLLQNCTNLLQPNNNQQIQSIWSHPGLQHDKSLIQNSLTGQQLTPTSGGVLVSNVDDLMQSSGGSMPTTNNENIQQRHHHHAHHQINSSSATTNPTTTVATLQHPHLVNVNNSHHQSNQQLSPDASPTTNQQIWSLYQSNGASSVNSLYNKCIMGLNQLRLVEFSGFLEKRRDPEIIYKKKFKAFNYQKHLFVHLNTSELTSGPSVNSNSVTNGDVNLNDDFESINYKEFADKFPENDLLWSTNTVTDKCPCSAYLIKFWVDLNYMLEEGVSSLYAVTNIFESPEPMTISCSTKVCSFGYQVVEKVENEQAQYENGRYVYRFENSPMCEYMITFINKLKQLPEKNLKNSVLENFSVLQSIKNHDTKELLLTLAYVFEVSTSEHGAQHVIYRLTNK